jgi:hypothetical protein
MALFVAVHESGCLHRYTTSVANGAQRKSTGSRLLQRATLVTRTEHHCLDRHTRLRNHKLGQHGIE